MTTMIAITALGSVGGVTQLAQSPAPDRTLLNVVAAVARSNLEAAASVSGLHSGSMFGAAWVIDAIRTLVGQKTTGARGSQINATA